MNVDTAEFVLSAHQPGQFLRDGLPEVAFVGRSNVGKSSLMNRLLRRKGLARTGSTPGRTRAVNYFLINRRFYFVDLPGYGFAKAPRTERQRWAQLMGQYFDRAGSVAAGPPAAGPPAAGQQTERRTLLVQLIDAKVGATELDGEAWEYFWSLGLSPLLAATKIDKVKRSRRVRSLAAIGERLALADRSAVVPFSAVTGEGAGTLWRGIEEFLLPPSHPVARETAAGASLETGVT